MISLSVAETARLLAAEFTGAAGASDLLTSVVVDSRQVQPGALFVALPGAHVDGHDFVAAAFRAGAAAALTSRPVPGAGGPCLVVADPLAALGQLSRHLVELARRGGLRVVGITGSQGKTSTKDLLAQVLEAAGPTVAPYGNLNNEIGLPLTVARITEETRFLVAEMGARGVGHIAYLCRVAPPTVGVVLNVGRAHVGEFGSQAAIAQAKGELVEALPADGTAVLNAQDRLVWSMRTRTAARVLATSATGDPKTELAAWAEGVELGPEGAPRFQLCTRWEGEAAPKVEVQLAAPGRHHVANALAAAGAAVALGLSPDVVAAALSAARPRSRWRLELHRRTDGVLVINDAYNANPEAMQAAIDTAVELRPPGASVWAVLGDMLELGPAAAQAHAEVGGYAARAGVNRLIALGEHAPELVAAAVTEDPSIRAAAVADKSTAVELVLAGLVPNDVVLVKASRGLALETVADAILAAGHRSSEDSP